MFSQKLLACIAALALSGCVTTSISGYADRDPPSQPIRRIATLVSASEGLARQIQTAVREEAGKRAILSEDALAIFPPTRTYSDEEVRRDLLTQNFDAVLLVKTSDSGIRREYVGTILTGNYSGNVSPSGFGYQTSGSFQASARPVFRHDRTTQFSATLVETRTGRTVWVGGGNVVAGGRLFVGDGVSGSNTAVAIFNDLDSKGILRK